MLTSILNVLLSPLNLFLYIINLIYQLIFIIQLGLSESCASIFGWGYGCLIINPNYVFNHVVTGSLLWWYVLHLCFKIYFKLVD